jgi:hypothetical protein
LLETVDNSSERERPCDIQKLINLRELWKLYRIDGIRNESLRHLPRPSLVHITHLFYHCFQPSHFPSPLKEAKVITLSQLDKDSKCPQNLRPISLVSTTDKLFKKAILKIDLKHAEEKNLLHAGQFGFRARHGMILQCVRLTEHAALNFNKSLFTPAVFLDIEKSFDTT